MCARSRTRRPRRRALLTAICLCLWWLGAPAAAQDYPKLSPFTAVDCRGDEARVTFGGEERELVSIDGLATAKILAFCRERYRDRWEKRFAEDLVEVLSEMGRPPGETVSLVLRDPATGAVAEVARAPMTRENRQAVLRARSRARDDPAGDAVRAVEEFARALDERWSYRRARAAGIDAAIERLRRSAASGISIDMLGIEMQKVIALGIDGHARVGGYRLPGAFLPFLVEPAGERLVAFLPDRSGFLDPESPFVVAIDGLEIEKCVAATAALVSRGSPQYVRRHALRLLRHLDYWRGELGLERRRTVRVELASASGKRASVDLPLAAGMPVYGSWPRGGSRMLDGEIGYLRLAAMQEPNATREIREWMPRFRRARGLVVDARDNGGGSRDALRLFFSYLARPGDRPRVVNCAAYRLHESHPEDHLAARFMYREESEVWSPSESDAIRSFKRAFRPEWTPPEGEFSDWHYMVLGRLDDPAVFHFGRPVVVLMNAKCFSATDVFLSALKGWRDVTLVGTSSGGGSARAQTVRLPAGRLSVTLGSMASFQADGRLFDGRGVEPDVVVEATPESFIGGSDNVLERAVEVLRRRR